MTKKRNYSKIATADLLQSYRSYRVLLLRSLGKFMVPVGMIVMMLSLGPMPEDAPEGFVRVVDVFTVIVSFVIAGGLMLFGGRAALCVRMLVEIIEEGRRRGVKDKDFR